MDGATRGVAAQHGISEAVVYRRPLAVVPAWTRPHVARLIAGRSVAIVTCRRTVSQVVLADDATHLSAGLTRR